MHLNIGLEVGTQAILTIGALARPNDERPAAALSHASWLSLYQLFSLPWFTRMWVIQEYVVPQSISEFWVGCVPFNPMMMLRGALEIFGMDNIPLSTGERVAMLGGIKNFLSLIDTKVQFESIIDGHIFTSFLWSFRDHDATDPRDKVYSLLGVIEDSNVGFQTEISPSADIGATIDLNKIIVDYRAPVEEVYASLTRAIINATHSLNVICACQGSSSFRRSWVPDWSLPWQYFSLLIDNVYSSCGETRSKTQYRASGSKIGSILFSNDLSRIRAEGILCCHVLYLVKSPSAEANQGYFEQALHLYDELNPELRTLLSSVYTEMEYEEMDEGTDLTQLGWVLATVGGGLRPGECLARIWRYFCPKAREEWHHLINSYNHDFNMNAANWGEEDVALFDVRIAQIGQGRSIFISETGYCGLLPEHAKEGDCLCVLFGCDVPVVLRKAGDFYTFIGECYIQGLMDGEAITELEVGNKTSQEFEIL